MWWPVSSERRSGQSADVDNSPNENPDEFLIIFLIVIMKLCYCNQVISDNSQTISKRNFENIPTTARDMGNGYEALQDHDGGEGDNGKGAGEPGN